MSTLQDLAREFIGTLFPAEKTLLQNAVNGTLAICGPSDSLTDPANDPSTADRWGHHRTIRGELIRWLCTDRRASPFVAHGGIQIFGAQIAGPVTLISASIEFPLAFGCCVLQNEINLQSGRARTLSFIQTYLESVYADGAVLRGAFLVRNSRAAMLQFPGAQVDGQFDCEGSSFNKLVLDGAVIGVGVLLRKVQGQVKMSRARISTDLDCGDSFFNTIAGSSEPALEAGGIKVEGSVFFREGFRSSGSVRLVAAQIGSNLECTHAEFDAGPKLPSGVRDALRADSIIVHGTVFLANAFRARGEVSFISAQIRGDFNCAHAEFDTGLILERANVQGTFFWRNVKLAANARLDLIDTSVGSLGDDRTSWPSQGNLQLHGFVYERLSLSSPRNVEDRIEWLALQESFGLHPYRQLANALRDEGNGRAAQKVLFEMERRRRRKSDYTWYARARSFLFEKTLGYGYYPAPSAGRCLVALIVLGLLLFGMGYSSGVIVPTDKEAYTLFKRDRQVPAYYERFHVSMYSLENTFQVFKLGQTENWQPDPSQGINWGSLHRVSCVPSAIFATIVLLYQWLQTVLGWFFGVAFLAGLAGIVRKD